MNEAELSREIFGEKRLWKGKNGIYEISWCSLCRIFSIHKEGGCECHGSSCNACGCKKCIEDFDLFEKNKYQITDYFSQEEFAIYEKVIKLQELMLNSLAAGEKEINWEKLTKEGEFSDNDRKTFKEFFLAKIPFPLGDG